MNTAEGSVLLTGDMEKRMSVPDKVDVLKVAHHGSKGVQTNVRASVRVISVGANNPFGHPHESTQPALRTDRLGAITVRLFPGGPRIALTEFRQSCKLALLFRATN
jgi:beta-lactamase superfamily II metal-dependent hydrolase